MAILALVYMAAGYWAVNRTLYANRVVIYSNRTGLFIQKFVYAVFLGWVLIPIALLKKLFGR